MLTVMLASNTHQRQAAVTGHTDSHVWRRQVSFMVQRTADREVEVFLLPAVLVDRLRNLSTEHCDAQPAARQEASTLLQQTTGLPNWPSSQ